MKSVNKNKKFEIWRQQGNFPETSGEKWRQDQSKEGRQ